MKLKVLKLDDAKVPTYAHPGDAGMDIYFLGVESPDGEMLPKAFVPGERYLCKSGIAIQMEEGFEAQVRSKSGLSLKQGLVVLNSPGTIDNGYRGEIGALIHNVSDRVQVLQPGEKMAQLVFAPIYRAEVEVVEELDANERGARGFGSSGRT